MTSVARMTDGIYRIDFGRVKGAGSGIDLSCSLVYLIVSDGEMALVDTSPAAVSSAIIEAIRGLGYDPSCLSRIILTHIHLDHAGGAGTLTQQLPKAKVVVHQRGASHLGNPERLVESTKQAFGVNFEADYGQILPVPERQVQSVEDGDVLHVGQRELRVVYTPGHAPHHICIYDALSGGLFSGDSLGALNTGNNPIVIVAGFNLDYALESIDRMKALKPKRVFAAHGTADREADEFIQSARNTTKDYGDIILEALREGKSQEEMTKRLLKYYRDRNSDDSPGELGRFDVVIPCYVAHFKRKGVV